jgi:hypothetical protein
MNRKGKPSSSTHIVHRPSNIIDVRSSSYQTSELPLNKKRSIAIQCKPTSLANLINTACIHIAKHMIGAAHVNPREIKKVCLPCSVSAMLDVGSPVCPLNKHLMQDSNASLLKCFWRRMFNHPTLINMCELVKPLTNTCNHQPCQQPKQTMKQRFVIQCETDAHMCTDIAHVLKAITTDPRRQTMGHRLQLFEAGSMQLHLPITLKVWLLWETHIQCCSVKAEEAQYVY